MSAPLRAALTEAYDSWLSERLADGTGGIALAAVGSLGRQEPSPWSDLDLVLVHTRRREDAARIADSVWYPVWDSGIGLDHSVRTPDEALAVAKDDVKAMLGLLDLRHVSGDESVTADLRARIRDLWRSVAAKRVPELRVLAQERLKLAGEGAFLLEPNLKDSRGGLRDVRTLVALAIAQLIDLPPAVRAANEVLLDVRGELHRLVGRADDVLRLQEHDAVAAALGLTDEDGLPGRDQMLRAVNHAARTVSHALDSAFGRIAAPVARTPLRRRLFGATAAPVREGLARDVVAQEGEVVLARDAAPATDSGLVVRAARAAAENGLPLAAYTLDRLAAQSTTPDVPWPEDVRNDFVTLLGTGAAAVPVLESLDLAGLLEPLIPEWAQVRSRAQHNPVHRYTVDRHLLETAAHAAEHTREVARPDLLLMGALLHDIGKGYAGDHSVVGAGHAATIARRMGFTEQEADTVGALTRHHLLLPDTATRRDLDDPRTLNIVTSAVEGSTELLELLHMLSIADAAATGPAAWSEWKGALIQDLVTRTRAVLAGAEPPAESPLDAERLELAAQGRLAVVIRDREVVVAAPDRVGVLYRTAGVLALHMLNIRQASIRTHEGMAVNSFQVEPRYGAIPDAAIVRADLTRALDGQIPLAERLREKERAYAERRERRRPPTVLWFDEEATDATILEVRTEDSIGLLTRLTAGLERSQVDVRSARVSTLGASVVLAFYLTEQNGRRIAKARRQDIELELRSI